MNRPLNPEKSQKLRPLRIVLAILIAVLIVIVLDRLPTSVKDRENKVSTISSVETRETPEGAAYYYLNGLLEILETNLEKRFEELGVPEEEYQNASEYFSKDEIFEIETKTKLAVDLEKVYIEATDEEIKDLKKIFDIDDDYSFEKSETIPSEYKILADLLAEYHQTMTTVEDYDAPVE